MIPDEAVEAARVAVRAAMIEFGPDGHTDGDEEITRAALEAAAPYMLAEAKAEAIEEAADKSWADLLEHARKTQSIPGADYLRDSLRTRAAAVRGEG